MHWQTTTWGLSIYHVVAMYIVQILLALLSVPFGALIGFILAVLAVAWLYAKRAKQQMPSNMIWTIVIASTVLSLLIEFLIVGKLLYFASGIYLLGLLIVLVLHYLALKKLTKKFAA
jgi:hypothetical protein